MGSLRMINTKGIIERFLLFIFKIILIINIIGYLILIWAVFTNDILFSLLMSIIIIVGLGFTIFLLNKKSKHYIREVIFYNDKINLIYSKKRKESIRINDFICCYKYKKMYLYYFDNNFQHNKLTRKGIVWSYLLNKKINEKILDIIKTKDIKIIYVSLSQFNTKGSIDMRNINQFKIFKEELFRD